MCQHDAVPTANKKGGILKKCCFPQYLSIVYCYNSCGFLRTGKYYLCKKYFVMADSKVLTVPYTVHTQSIFDEVAGGKEVEGV
jgi:hypothetical protein